MVDIARTVLSNTTAYKSDDGMWSNCAPKAGIDNNMKVYSVGLYTLSSTRNVLLWYCNYPYNNAVPPSDWSYRNLTGHTGGSANFKYHVTMAIASDGSIHVAYSGADGGIIKIRYLKYTPWNDTVVTHKNVAGYDASYDQEYPYIAVDSSGYAHIVWLGRGWGSFPSQRQVCYARSDESVKTPASPPTLIAQGNYWYDYLNMNIDSSGNRWVHYYDGTSSLYRKYTTTWGAETTARASMKLLNIIMDGNDDHHALIVSGANLQYNWYDVSADTWGTAETIKSSGFLHYGQIGFRNNSYDVAVFYHQTSLYYYKIGYRKRVGSSWDTEISLQQTPFTRMQDVTDNSFARPCVSFAHPTWGDIIFWGKYDDVPTSGTHHRYMNIYDYWNRRRDIDIF